VAPFVKKWGGRKGKLADYRRNICEEYAELVVGWLFWFWRGYDPLGRPLAGGMMCLLGKRV
jgi:hypothetical protein